MRIYLIKSKTLTYKKSAIKWHNFLHNFFFYIWWRHLSLNETYCTFFRCHNNYQNDVAMATDVSNTCLWYLPDVIGDPKVSTHLYAPMSDILEALSPYLIRKDRVAIYVAFQGIIVHIANILDSWASSITILTNAVYTREFETLWWKI